MQWKNNKPQFLIVSSQLTQVKRQKSTLQDGKEKTQNRNYYPDSLDFHSLATEPILSSLYISGIIFLQKQLYMVEVICSLEIC